MRAVAVLLLAALALAAPGMTGASSPAKTELRIGSLNPLTVRGTGFRPREKVTLRVTAPRPVARSVRASAAGSFSIRLRIRVGRCVAVVIQATGSRGSRASASLDQPDCAPTSG